jgi:hypothetical protein
MVKQITPGESQATIEAMQKRQFEQERMADVLFLLDLVFTREEVTVKQILDSLYDIGSINLINQRIQARWLNRLAKWIARSSKPVFRSYALRWVKRNSPQLITDWLYSQVKFEPKQIAQIVEAAEVAEAAEIQAAPAATELELYRQEVRLLHSRVRLLTTLLIGVTVTLGSGLAWALWRDQTQSARQPNPASQLATQVEPCPAHAFQPCR